MESLAMDANINTFLGDTNPTVVMYNQLHMDKLNIVPKPRSLLERLVGLRTPVFFINEFDKSGLQYTTINEIANSGLSYVTGLELKKTAEQSLKEISTDPYINSLEKISDDLAVIIRNHVGFIKNVVKPKVEEFMTIVYERYSSHKPEQPGSSFNIIQCKLPDVIFNGVFEDMIGDYKGNRIDNNFKYKQGIWLVDAIVESNKQDLIEFIKTGNEEIDNAVLAIVSNLEYEDIRDTMGHVANTIDFANRNIYKRTNACVFGYLFHYAMFEKDIPNFILDSLDKENGMSLKTVKDWAAERRDFFGTLLANARIEGSLENPIYKDNVVISIENDTVYVVSHTYKRWLSEGGVIETLYGMLVSGDTYFTINELKANQDKLLNVWKSHCLFHASFQKNQSFNIFTDVCRAVFLEGISDPSPEEKEYFSKVTTAQDKAVAIFFERLKELTISDMDDPTHAAIKLVAGARFYYTDAEDYLTNMMTFMKMCPDCNVDDAVVYATLLYTFNYVSDQIGVS